MEDETAPGEEIIGGSKVRDLSSMSIIVWPVESDECRFDRWALHISTPFLFSMY